MKAVSVILCVITAFSLTACAQGVGEPGSLLWKLTANDNEKLYFADERRTDARLQCARNRYDGNGYEACVENALKY